MQFVKLEVDRKVQADHQFTKKYLQFKQKCDETHMGAKLAFAGVRGPSMPPVTQLKDETVLQVDWQPANHTVECTFPHEIELSPCNSFRIGSLQGKVLAMSPQKCTLHVPDLTESGPPRETLTCTAIIFDPALVVFGSQSGRPQPDPS